jgi:hypothetical protein
MTEAKIFKVFCFLVYSCAMLKNAANAANGLTEHSLDILRCSQIHSHNTRNKDTIRLPKVKRNWGKQRTNYQAIKDWNDLDSDTRNAPTLVSFKRNLFSKLLT